MTSPEVNVGSIIARVALDTSGLKRGEAESTASLKRTASGLSQTAQSADKVQRKVNDASAAIKRNTDVQVDAIRRTSREEQRARQERPSESVRSGAARGSVAGVVAGQLISSGISNLQDGKGGARDAAGSILGGALAGGAIGSVAGPVGTVAGALIGAGGAGVMSAFRFSQAQIAEADAQRAKENAVINKQLRAYLAKHPSRLSDQNISLIARMNAPQSAQVLDTRAALTDPNALGQQAQIVSPLTGGFFDEHARMTQGDVGKAMDKVAAAMERLGKAEDHLQHVRSKTGGKSALLSAEASVASARAAVASGKGDPAAAALRLAAAEQRLNEVRKRGGDNYGLKTAGQSVADARAAVDKAQAEAVKAGAPKALDAKTLLSRLAVKEADVKALDRDTRTLVRKGLRAPVVEELLRTEKDAPGTIHKLAGSMTRSQLMEFNRRASDMKRAADDLIKAPLDRAYADARRDAERQARSVAVATRNAMIKAAAEQGGVPSLDQLLLGQPVPNPTPPGAGPNYTPRQDPDTRRNGRPAASVVITGPVTVQANTPTGLVGAITKETRVNALSRP